MTKVQGQGMSRHVEAALKIGQAAKLAGVRIDTVRFYERAGLLPKAARSRAGYRLFTAAAVERVIFIKKAQALGFTLVELRSILRSVDRGAGTQKSAQLQLDNVIARIDVKLAELRRLRRRLGEARDEMSSGKCAIERIVKRISFAQPRVDESSQPSVDRRRSRSR